MRYLVTTRRGQSSPVVSAREACSAEPGVKLVNSENPQMVTIEASEDAATRLKQKIGNTHFVEPEVRRSLQ
jgi:hypothetical protein